MKKQIQFSPCLTETILLTKEEEESLPPSYIEGNIKMHYFAFLVEKHLGYGNIAFERFYHFVLKGNALHVRVHNEQRNWVWRWDGEPNMSSSFYMKFKIDPSKDDPFILKMKY